MPAPTITYRTTDPLKWGDGKSANLTASEVDENFYNLAQATASVAALEPHEITSITVTGNAMTIHLDGGETFGPFTLPVASLRFRDFWLPDTNYAFADLFTAAQGLYMVRQDHTSAAVFAPDAGNGSGPYYQLIIPFPQLYDISFFWPGFPGTGIPIGGTMMAHVALRNFFLPQDLPGSIAKLEFAVDADSSYVIKRNNTAIGSVSFASGQTVATFVLTADTQFTPGDVLRVVRPEAIDVAGSGLTLTFAGVIGDIPEEPSA